MVEPPETLILEDQEDPLLVLLDGEPWAISMVPQSLLCQLQSSQYNKEPHLMMARTHDEEIE